MNRIERLEEENEFQEATINNQAMQAIGKNKLIKELQSQLSDALELITALEAGQNTIMKRFKEVDNNLDLAVGVLTDIRDLTPSQHYQTSTRAGNALSVLSGDRL